MSQVLVVMKDIEDFLQPVSGLLFIYAFPIFLSRKKNPHEIPLQEAVCAQGLVKCRAVMGSTHIDGLLLKPVNKLFCVVCPEQEER